LFATLAVSSPVHSQSCFYPTD